MQWSEIDKLINYNLHGRDVASEMVTPTERLFYANIGQRIFVKQSRCLKKNGGWSVALTANSETRTYPMPADGNGKQECLYLERATFDDDEIGIRDVGWIRTQHGDDWRDDEGTTITDIFLDLSGPNYFDIYPLLSSGASVTEIYLFGVARPTDITQASSVPEFPEEYHHALVHFVCKWALEKTTEYKNLEEAAFHEAKFQALVEDAKLFAGNAFHAGYQSRGTIRPM